MNFSSSHNPPVYFWVTGLTALVWNIFAVYSYVLQDYSNSGQFNELSDADQILADDFPAWYISAFAIAVFAGLLGAIFLLFRKRWAYYVFIIALISTGIQQFYVLTVVNPRDIFLSLSALVICVFLVWFSRLAIGREWLN